MPRGDRTGPRGFGRLTGRRAGYCAGYDAPGYANPTDDGYGYGGRGRGYRRRNFSYRGPRRGFFAYPGYGYAEPYEPAIDEKEFLKREEEYLESELENIKKRLSNIKEKED